MFSFNLLPPVYQRRTMRWLVLRHLHHGLLWCTSAAAVVAILVVSTGWYLQQSLNKENERLQQILSEPLLNQLSTNVHAINQRIATLRSIQQQHRTSVPLITALIDTLPDDISLTTMDIDYEHERIQISGVARDRTALKSVQEAFEQDELFNIEQFPFEEFAQATAIPFDIVITMQNSDFQLDDLAL